ncbi:HAMP domain-containing sensor histidine kinase [Pleomorphomonas sp. JP5]|uniref:sensor histidine kinase n=1 Tax=Pleomorphomonas sp. JP5 TaxID=2942998 RepID=UPI00204438EC|nr:ATP-binding protein [Pleomorphomonas sp. JP5]MCM5556689.1 ATP-binding protein [Pleomorphomonas sp. JP5]
MSGRRRKRLAGLVARRILVFALLAMLLQVAMVFARYWFDDEELGHILVERETEAISASVHRVAGLLTLDPDAPVLDRYMGDVDVDDMDAGDHADDEVGNHPPPATFVRIRGADGRVIYSNCGEECEEHFLPPPGNAPDFWQRAIEPGKPLSVAGGRAFVIDGERVLIDVAVLHDPGNFLGSILTHEMIDHMLVPMGLMLVLTIGATILSIGAALRPVSAAAQAADALDPRSPTSLSIDEAMPLEVAGLVEAINRLFARTAEIMAAQKVFSAAVAHEIRTPLAVLRLELDRIADPRARRAEADIERLLHILEQLTALARLDVVDDDAFVETDLAGLAADVVADMAPLVLDRGATIAYEGDGPVPRRLVPSLIQNVVRNLIENSLKHAGRGVDIVVAVGLDGSLTVSDNGSGFVPCEVQGEFGRVKRSGSLGLGLTIVERIAELHGAALSVRSAPGEGCSVHLAFVHE